MLKPFALEVSIVSQAKANEVVWGHVLDNLHLKFERKVEDATVGEEATIAIGACYAPSTGATTGVCSRARHNLTIVSVRRFSSVRNMIRHDRKARKFRSPSFAKMVAVRYHGANLI